jgi:hypothetical protein
MLENGTPRTQPTNARTDRIAHDGPNITEAIHPIADTTDAPEKHDHNDTE